MIDWFEKTALLSQISALLTIIAIPYAFVKLVVYKARHKIFFSPKDTYYEVKLLDHPGQPQSYWLHLMIKNDGFEVSKNVEAYLTEIWIKNDEDKYVKVNEFRAPVKLKWAHEGDIVPIDIMPRNERRLDVCYICKDEKILRLMARSFPSGSIKNELPAGNYTFVINVVSQNSLRPAKFIFEVNWNGNWKTLVGDNFVKSFKFVKKPARSFSYY
jgi:hypothetical protein